PHDCAFPGRSSRPPGQVIPILASAAAPPGASDTSCSPSFASRKPRFAVKLGFDNNRHAGASVPCWRPYEARQSAAFLMVGERSNEKIKQGRMAWPTECPDEL